MEKEIMIEKVETTEQPAPTEALSLEDMADGESAMKVLQSSLQEFVTKIKNFSGSKRQLEDVIINLMVSPLEKDNPEWSYPEQKELFDVGVAVGSTKFFLMLAGLQSEGKIVFTDKEDHLSDESTNLVDSSTNLV